MNLHEKEMWRLCRMLDESGFRPEEVTEDDHVVEVHGWQQAINECLAVEMPTLHLDTGDWVFFVFEHDNDLIVSDYPTGSPTLELVMEEFHENAPAARTA
jgi:hypothetical protein